MAAVVHVQRGPGIVGGQEYQDVAVKRDLEHHVAFLRFFRHFQVRSIRLRRFEVHEADGDAVFDAAAGDVPAAWIDDDLFRGFRRLKGRRPASRSRTVTGPSSVLETSK